MRQQKYLKYLTKNSAKRIKILKLLLRVDFHAAVENLRERYPNLLSSVLTSKGLEINVRLNGGSMSKFDRDVERLLYQFELPHTWYDFVKQYIVSNDFFPKEDYDPDGVVLEIEGTKDTGQRAHLLLHPRLTLKNIQEAWPLIKKEISVTRPEERKGRQSKFERDYAIFKMAERGLTISEICSEIRKRFNEDLDFGVIKNAESKMRMMLRIKNKRYKLRTIKKSLG